MSTETNVAPSFIETPAATAQKAAFGILATISFCHFLNDTVQSLLPAIYPLLKSSLNLDFGQIGLIALTVQVTASILQPLVGFYTDRRPKPYSLAFGMGITLLGLLLLAHASTFGLVLVAAGLVGMGSSIFHPESSRVARMASGGQHGLAQSVFQVGGNAGSSLGPLLAAFFVMPRGQSSIAWFSLVALLGIIVLVRVGAWAKRAIANRRMRAIRPGAAPVRAAHAFHDEAGPDLPRSKINRSLAILVALIFSKYFYLASLISYYIFYLISKFHVSVENAQVHLFVFLGAVAAGTVIGGPIGDRIGRKYVIWVSILGVLPFTLLLPHANLFWTGVLSVVIGVILASAFSAILVYAQELVPGKVGTISGLFFGLAFGLGGLGAALLGKLADLTSIYFVYHLCAYLPAIGILTAFLPDLGPAKVYADRPEKV